MSRVAEDTMYNPNIVSFSFMGEDQFFFFLYICYILQALYIKCKYLICKT